MIFTWIFVIVFPIVLIIQLMSQRKLARKNKEQLSLRHFLTALIHTIILTLVAFVAYFFGIAVNA